VLVSLLTDGLLLAGLGVGISSSSFTKLVEFLIKVGEKDRTGDCGEDGVESDECIDKG